MSAAAVDTAERAPTAPPARPPACGRPLHTNAFTAVVPVRRHRLGLLRLSMLVLGHLPSAGLDRLSIIHFGQWGLLRRAPTGDTTDTTTRSGRWMRRHRSQLRNTLVFASSYDGDRDDYIVAFARGIKWGFRGVFGQCTDFPGVTPSGRLLSYIEQYRYDSTFFWSAYPDATLKEIREALHVERAIRSLCDDAASATVSDARVRQAFEGLARELQYGSMRARCTPRWKLLWRAFSNPMVTGTLTSLLPVRSGHEQAIGEDLERLRDLDGAVFAGVEGTHFARLTLVDRLRDPGNQPLTFEPTYLLVSVQFDGDLASYLRRWCDADPLLLTVLGHCEAEGSGDIPEADGEGLRERLERSRVPNGLFLTGTGGRTVVEIREALALLAPVRDLLARAGGLSDAELRDTIRREVRP